MPRTGASARAAPEEELDIAKRWSGRKFAAAWEKARSRDRTLSARRLATASGVWPQTVYNWARKDSTPPTFDQVLALASELEVDPEVFTDDR